MLQNFSVHTLGNSELISMILVIAALLFIASLIYKKLPKEDKETQSSLFKKIKKHDIFWMVLLSGLYAIVSLWNLGSFETIGSFWQPVSDHEEIILQLSESDFDEIIWVSGEGDNTPVSYQNQVDFLIQGSNNQQDWYDLCELTTKDYLKIQHQAGSWAYDYIKIIPPCKVFFCLPLGLNWVKIGESEIGVYRSAAPLAPPLGGAVKNL